MKKFLYILFFILIIIFAFYMLKKKNVVYKIFHLEKKESKKREKGKREHLEKYLTQIATKGEGKTYLPEINVTIDFKLKYINPDSNKPDFFIVTVYNNGKKIIKNLWVKLSVYDKALKKEVSKKYQLVLDDNSKNGDRRKCILNWASFPENWDKKSFKITITKIEYRGKQNEKKS